ncbi:MAG TPA: 6-phosphogluconolactonase [Saprospiraceae bacterium]|nr:6-phosphogluconolactonase [Saprospiraceae bacterium]
MDIKLVLNENFVSISAEVILNSIQKNLKQKPTCSIVLSGGSTPIPVYEKIIKIWHEYKIDWSACYFFWGDERMVPADDKENNAHNGIIHLLDHLPVDKNKIFRVDTGLSPAEAATQYSHTIEAFFSETGNKNFDLVLLGMGSDGHTLSLFPHQPILKDMVSTVTGYYVDESKGSRVTMMPILVNNSSGVVFLIKGEDKSLAAYHVIQNNLADKYSYPAKLIQPEDGNLLFIIDLDAASQLDACAG